MSSFILEKAVIALSLLMGYPLFFLDKDLFAARRYGWLLASTCGLASLFMFGGMTTEEETKDDPQLSMLLDKATVAAICVSAIPHFNKLIQDSIMLGLSTIPPMFVVIHMSTKTIVGSEAYWRLRCFLHLTIFIIPYLNHLPSEVKKDVAKEEESPTETKKDK